MLQFEQIQFCQQTGACYGVYFRNCFNYCWYFSIAHSDYPHPNIDPQKQLVDQILKAPKFSPSFARPPFKPTLPYTYALTLYIFKHSSHFLHIRTFYSYRLLDHSLHFNKIFIFPHKQIQITLKSFSFPTNIR